MNKFLSTLKRINRNVFWFQSVVFWIVALTHFSTDKFWYFATAAIIFGGIDDILKELRKSNKEQNGES